jgi:hypothetical protein
MGMDNPDQSRFPTLPSSREKSLFKPLGGVHNVNPGTLFAPGPSVNGALGLPPDCCENQCKSMLAKIREINPRAHDHD